MPPSLLVKTINSWSWEEVQRARSSMEHIMIQSTLISEDRDLKSDIGQDSIETAFFQTGKGKSLSSPRPEGSTIKIIEETPHISFISMTSSYKKSGSMNKCNPSIHDMANSLSLLLFQKEQPSLPTEITHHK